MIHSGLALGPVIAFLVWLALVIYLLVLASRLVSAVERIADKLQT